MEANMGFYVGCFTYRGALGMSNFYDGLCEANAYYGNKSHRECLTWYQLEAFENHGNFLNGLPVVDMMDVAEKVIEICLDYNKRDKKLMDLKLTDQDESDIRAEHGEKHTSILIARKRRRGSHLGAAKKFRSMLVNVKEACELSNDETLPRKVLGWDLDRKGYYMMVDLIDTFIDDLENETYKMVSANAYISPYPSKTPLRDYLMGITKKYNIKNGKKLVYPLIVDFDRKRE